MYKRGKREDRSIDRDRASERERVRERKRKSEGERAMGGVGIERESVCFLKEIARCKEYL